MLGRDLLRAARSRHLASQAAKVEFFNKALAVYAAAGEPFRAEATLRRMLDAKVKPDLRSFNCIVRSHAAAGDQKRAQAWLLRMAAEFGEQPDVESAIRVGDVYALMVEWFHSQGQMDQAYSLIEKMVARSIVLAQSHTQCTSLLWIECSMH